MQKMTEDEFSAVLRNLIVPVVCFVLVYCMYGSLHYLAVSIGVYLVGGFITARFVERDGGEHPAVVFTGWYAFLTGALD